MRAGNDAAHDRDSQRRGIGRAMRTIYSPEVAAVEKFDDLIAKLSVPPPESAVVQKLDNLIDRLATPPANGTQSPAPGEPGGGAIAPSPGMPSKH